MRTSLSLSLILLLAACQQPKKEDREGSQLTEVSISAPDSKMFPAGSPESKIKSIRVDLIPLKTKDERFACTNQKEMSSQTDYDRSGQKTLSFKLLQVCSYTFSMKLLGENDTEIFYEGRSDATTEMLRGQDNLKIDINLNLTDLGAKLGFGKLGSKEGATTVSGEANQDRQTEVTLASQLGKDSCNITHLVTVDRKATKTVDDPKDTKKLSFFSALRLFKANENDAHKDIKKSLTEACGASFSTYTVRCEVSIDLEALTFKSEKQESLNRKVTTPAFKLDATQAIEEVFTLKNVYEQSTAKIELGYCLAKKP